MIFERTIIDGCYLVKPILFNDDRGWFARFFCDDLFSEIGKNIHFKQINHSFNTYKGTFRGMHYQESPHLEDKLVRCLSGKVLDYVLDIRKDSPTFLKHISVELNTENKTMIFIPKGLAHGFQTLEDNTELLYHHTKEYCKGSDRGLRYNDPKININLSLPLRMISEKDKNYQLITNDFKGITI